MNKRFDQLLSFLKAPQAHPHPAITLEDRIYVKRGTLRALKVKECSQEAIEIIIKLEFFRRGLLKGNQRTPDMPINRLEDFVLEVATAILLAKRQLSGSLWPYYLRSDGQPQVIEDLLITTHDNMMEAFDQFKEIALNSPHCNKGETPCSPRQASAH